MNLWMLATYFGKELDDIIDNGMDSCQMCELYSGWHYHDCPIPVLVQVRQRMRPVRREA